MTPARFSQVARQECRALIERALAEDLGAATPPRQRDITSEAIVPASARGAAHLVARKSGVVCGLPVCAEVLDIAGVEVNLDLLADDGDRVEGQQRLATLSGPARDILKIERTCLNFLGRLSGISTLTARFAAEVRDTGAAVLDTRKTTPGWRHLEKYAVACGGGVNHRLGLHDAILIKDNHLAMMDLLTDEPLVEVREAIVAARQWIDQHAAELPHGKETVLEIEVDRLEQFDLALQSGPDIILLDNMSPDQLREAVSRRNERQPAVLLEASGGITLETIGTVARTGVDRISVGALTHSAVNFDIGLDWQMDDLD